MVGGFAATSWLAQSKKKTKTAFENLVMMTS
jgi:hypothetical protein